MRAGYRDAGLSRQLWHVCLSILTRGRLKVFPPKGFVGLVSRSSPAIGLGRYRIKSIQLHRTASTRSVRLWRLTYVWGILLRPGQTGPSGPGLADIGDSSAGAGVVPSANRTSITSISRH